MHIYDVIIVGAGPIGLATGIGLRKRGIENCSGDRSGTRLSSSWPSRGSSA